VLAQGFGRKSAKAELVHLSFPFPRSEAEDNEPLVSPGPGKTASAASAAAAVAVVKPPSTPNLIDFDVVEPTPRLFVFGHTAL
jgi:hypothetical protein